MRIRNFIWQFRKWIILIVILAILVIAIPYIFARYINIKDQHISAPLGVEFPVGVDPINKTITENELVYNYFPNPDSSIPAATLLSLNKIGDIFSRLAVSIAEIIGNESLSLATGERFVQIPPGLRKEEVANAFGRALAWDEKEKKEFLSRQDGLALPLTEGSFFPGIYVVRVGATPEEIQDLVNKRFTNHVLSRYGTSTVAIVALDVGITIASLIQRETIGTNDMRVISGIIWNRIFRDMNLQLDATLQYARASNKAVSVWWPKVGPQDKFIKSPYNTYMHEGLPPTPIANPSVAAIVAALNPAKTECLFYFHDRKGDLYCTPTYEEHVALLKKHYGRGR